MLLAAGSGARMGHKPKCLLELDSVSLLRRQLLALLEDVVGGDNLVVVLGHHAQHTAPEVRGLPVTVVHNPNPDAGQVSSLRLGLQALKATFDCVLVALADQPLINRHDIKDLINAYNHRPLGTQVVQPCVDGLPGNPVMFSAEVRADILASPADVGCRQWQTAHPHAVHHWVSPNLHYRTDVDTPQDVEALAARTGHCLRWPHFLLPKATP